MSLSQQDEYLELPRAWLHGYERQDVDRLRGEIAESLLAMPGSVGIDSIRMRRNWGDRAG
jgi:hypothetical protein